MRSMNRSTHHPSLTARLDAEWHRLRHTPRAVRTVRSWSIAGSTHPFDVLAADVAVLDQIVAATQRDAGGPDDAERILARLVELARDHELAGRILVQRLLPGIIVRARRYRDHSCDTDPVAIAIAAAWLAIRAYDVERRPRQVAAALISDTMYLAFRRELRRRARTEVVMTDERFALIAADEPRATPFVELADVVRTATANGLPAADREFIRGFVRSGSSIAFADELGVTTRTVRNRRDRVVLNLRLALDGPLTVAA